MNSFPPQTRIGLLSLSVFLTMILALRGCSGATFCARDFLAVVGVAAFADFRETRRVLAGGVLVGTWVGDGGKDSKAGLTASSRALTYMSISS